MPVVGTKHYTSPGGALAVAVSSTRVLSTTMSGYLDVVLAEHFLASLDVWVKLGGSNLLAFHDWEALRDYDPDARLMLTPWSKQHRAQFEGVHILVNSRTVAWGIRIVNSLTRDVMVAHHSRTSFEQARRAI